MINKAPYTETQVETWNSLTHFPTTAQKLNEEYASMIDSERKNAIDQIRAFGLSHVPQEIEDALEYLAQAHINFKHEWQRARKIAPPWSVTGRSNYRGRADKAHKVEGNALEALDKAKEKLRLAIHRYSPNAAISSDDDEAVEKLQEKIAEAEKVHAAMVQCNKIIRSKLTQGEKIEALQKIAGEQKTRKLLTPNYMGKIGFEGWELSNNLANIKRMKERLAELSKRKSDTTKQIVFDGGEIVDNVEENRVQILFTAIPSEEMRNKLKANGFRWSPTNKAWQAFRGSNAKMKIDILFGVKL